MIEKLGSGTTKDIVKSIITKFFPEETNDNRQEFYKYVIEKLLEMRRPLHILETGTMHTIDQGSFTLVMAHLIKNYTGGKLTTIDINPDHIELCKEYTREYSDIIDYVVSDSVIYLNSLSDKLVANIDLFYFDSKDINLVNPEESQIHHLNELKSVIDRIKNKALISVDDNYLPHTVVEWIWNNGNSEEVHTGEGIVGKGTLIDELLTPKDEWSRIIELDKQYQNNVFLYEYTQPDIKTCFLVLSYCDTDLKLQAIHETLDNLKNFDIDICVHAHYPLPIEVQKKTNYYLYDYSNPVLYMPEKAHNTWKRLYGYTWSIIEPEIGYTVIQQIKRGVDFLKSIGYEQVYIINYDVLISDKVIDLVDNNYDSNVLMWEDDTINITFLSLKTNTDLSFMTRKNYVDDDLSCAETFIYKEFTKHFNIKEHPHESYKNNFVTTMNINNFRFEKNIFNDSDGADTVWQQYKYDDFELFISSYDGNLSILIYMLRGETSIDISIRGEHYNNKLTEEYYLHETDIPWGDIKSSDEINIKVNNVEIEKDTIDSLLNSDVFIRKV